MSYRVNQLMNNEGVCRAAPATPGILITRSHFEQLHGREGAELVIRLLSKQVTCHAWSYSWKHTNVQYRLTGSHIHVNTQGTRLTTEKGDIEHLTVFQNR